MISLLYCVQIHRRSVHPARAVCAPKTPSRSRSAWVTHLKRLFCWLSSPLRELFRFHRSPPPDFSCFSYLRAGDKHGCCKSGRAFGLKMIFSYYCCLYVYIFCLSFSRAFIVYDKDALRNDGKFLQGEVSCWCCPSVHWYSISRSFLSWHPIFSFLTQAWRYGLYLVF